jgi:hypothetical protein
MAKPVWQIQRELDYARAREAYYSNPNRPVKQTVDPRPRIQVVYAPLFFKVGAVYPELLLSASSAGVARMGGAAALGLVTTAIAIAEAGRPPRNFKPTILHAMVGDATPNMKRAYNGTGRRYVDYSGNTTGNAQAHFSAPVSCGNSTPTIDELETRVASIRGAIVASLGAYGRLWVDFEKSNKVLV